MRSLCTICLTVVLAAGATSCESGEELPDMATLMASLELDPAVELDVDCPPLPEGTEKVLFAGVFTNQPQIRPGEPNFPADFCPPETVFFARAEGRGNSSLLGEFIWSERYCAGAPSGGLTAEGVFEGSNGDQLNWEAVVRFTPPVSPDQPVTFSGQLTFIGGSGAQLGASGGANISAVQLGNATLNDPGSTAAALCGWIG